MDQQAAYEAVGELQTQLELFRQVAADDGSVVLTKEEMDELGDKVSAVSQAVRPDRASPEVARAALGEPEEQGPNDA